MWQHCTGPRGWIDKTGWGFVGGSEAQRGHLQPWADIWNEFAKWSGSEGWTDCPANLLPSRPEAGWNHSPLFTKRFLVPWNKRSALARYLCQSKYWEMSGPLTSELCVIACATAYICSPAPSPQNGNQVAEAELNAGKRGWGITRACQGMQAVRKEPKKSDQGLILQSFQHRRAQGMQRWWWMLPDVRLIISNYKQGTEMPAVLGSPRNPSLSFKTELKK